MERVGADRRRGLRARIHGGPSHHARSGERARRSGDGHRKYPTRRRESEGRRRERAHGADRGHGLGPLRGGDMEKATVRIETDSPFRPSEIMGDLRIVAETLYHPMRLVGFWDAAANTHMCPKPSSGSPVLTALRQDILVTCRTAARCSASSRPPSRSCFLMPMSACFSVEANRSRIADSVPGGTSC